MSTISIIPVEGLGEITTGTDLAATISGLYEVAPGDIVVVSQKVVSKAEGAVVDLGSITPSQRAKDLAEGRDPRLVQVVLNESIRLLRESPVLIAETHHGFICANAGVDQSNTGDETLVALLPPDPDASASALRVGLSRAAGGPVGVVIADSFGRAWRVGQCDIAIGCAGLAPLDDLRGSQDRDGRILAATLVATADQIAAAAELGRSKDSGHAVVIIRGLERITCEADGPGAKALLRSRASDLFR